MNDREEAITRFGRVLGLPELDRITQRGTDDNARYSFHLDTGAEIRIGPIDNLFSQAKLSLILARAVRRVPPRLKPAQWHDVLSIVIADGVDLDPGAGETFDATVLEWIRVYTTTTMTEDRDGAAAQREPFLDDQHVHLTANSLARHIRREYGERIHLPDLYNALTDLGFERVKVNFVRNGSDNRQQASYYRIPEARLDASASDTGEEK